MRLHIGAPACPGKRQALVRSGRPFVDDEQDGEAGSRLVVEVLDHRGGDPGFAYRRQGLRPIEDGTGRLLIGPMALLLQGREQVADLPHVRCNLPRGGTQQKTLHRTVINGSVNGLS